MASNIHDCGEKKKDKGLNKNLPMLDFHLSQLLGESTE